MLQLPNLLVDGVRGKICEKCCKNQLVLAHPTDSETHKNDFTGVYLKKGVLADTITFTMEDCDGLVVSNQGDPAIFPNDTLAVGYIYDWKKVLNIHGAGKYSIKANFNIASVVGSFTVNSFDLREFTRENVKETVRIYSEFNSFFLKDDIDFTDSNFKDTIRLNGFFGNREPETEINNLIDKGRKVLKATRENLNKYTLSTDPIEIGMSKQIIDFHLLNEDVIKISDYNRWNHDFQIFDIDVVLVDTPKIEYIEFDRRAKINVTFGDRKLLDKSYYR